MYFYSAHSGKDTGRVLNCKVVHQHVFLEPSLGFSLFLLSSWSRASWVNTTRCQGSRRSGKGILHFESPGFTWVAEATAAGWVEVDLAEVVMEEAEVGCTSIQPS